MQLGIATDFQIQFRDILVIKPITLGYKRDSEKSNAVKPFQGTL